jgi:hypothetical protein
MIEEPVQPFQRRVLVDLLEHVERARDCFVIGRMHPPGPFVLDKNADDVLELALHLRWQVRTGDAEIFKIGCREYEHFAGAVVAKVIRALFVLCGFGPIQEVGFLILRLLREQVVGQTDREQALVG